MVKLKIWVDNGYYYAKKNNPYITFFVDFTTFMKDRVPYYGVIMTNNVNKNYMLFSDMRFNELEEIEKIYFSVYLKHLDNKSKKEVAEKLIERLFLKEHSSVRSYIKGVANTKLSRMNKPRLNRKFRIKIINRNYKR